MATSKKLSGYFWSSIYAIPYLYTFVKGEIEADLVKPDLTMIFPCKLKYTGLYRNGQEEGGAINVSGNDISIIMTGQIGGKSILFTVTTHTKTEIKGTYLMESPYDKGTFTLNRA